MANMELLEDDLLAVYESDSEENGIEDLQDYMAKSPAYDPDYTPEYEAEAVPEENILDEDIPEEIQAMIHENEEEKMSDLIREYSTDPIQV